MRGIANSLVHVGHLEAIGAFDGQGQPCRPADLVELGLIARLQFVDQLQGLGEQLLGIFVRQVGKEGEGPQAVFEGILPCPALPLGGLSVAFSLRLPELADQVDAERQVLPCQLPLPYQCMSRKLLFRKILSRKLGPAVPALTSVSVHVP